MRFLFMCKSLTYAQRSEKALERAGISANIIKSPASLSTRGCGYSVSVNAGRGRQAAELLRNANLLQGKIFVQQADGSYREAEL